nr:uroplakin-2 [Caretta caretta]
MEAAGARGTGVGSDSQEYVSGGDLGAGARHCTAREQSLKPHGWSLPPATQGLKFDPISPVLSDFNISSFSSVLFPAFAESFLMAVPLCQFTGAHASIHITHLNGTTDIRHFTVPPCCGRHDLVNLMDSNGGFTLTRLDAYQVTNLVLTGSLALSISYSTPKKDPSRSTSNMVTMVTLERVDYRNTAVDISCSGVMVVITVLLSAGLIAVLAITGRK